MELRQYWKIVHRWWWLILLPPLAAGAYGLATYRAPAGGYALTLRYTAAQPQSADGPPERLYDPNYYRWLTSEYIVTALKDWVRTGKFAEAVNVRLAERGVATPAGSISAADNARSILVVYLAGNDPDQLLALADAVTAILQEQNAEIFPQLGGQAAEVTLLEAPTPVPVAPPLRARLDLPLKVGLGGAVGLALAFIAHYFDPFVREKREVEGMGLKVIAEIPKTSKRKKEEGRRT